MSDDLSGFSLMELFRTEAEEQLAVMSEGLLRLEQTGGGDAATIEPMMRAAHSLKGAARIVGMTAAERLAHALEDAFLAAQHGRVTLRPLHVDALLSVVDLLGELSRLDETALASWPVDHADRLAQTVETIRAVAEDRLPEPEGTTAVGGETPSHTGPAPPEGSDADLGASSETVAPAEPEPEPTPAPSEAETRKVPAPASVAPESADRVVRVTAESLNRLMALAGASLVEARQLRPVVDSLIGLKTMQAELWDVLQTFEDLTVCDTGEEAAHARELLARAKAQATRCLETLGGRIDRLEVHARRGEDLAERLHHEVITSRLRPLADGLRGFPRLVRDVSRQLGKSCRFEIVGEQTGVDRDILERLEAPLNHMIRNALDHGIEPPDQRAAAGKDPCATIRLEARHVAGMLLITLSDDGRGIDVEALRRRVVERGMVSAAMADQLSEAELLEFLFLSGFSTKGEVTDISGRGVGLDVVQSMAQAVGGSVRISTQPGRGTTFSMQLPITMSVIRALLVTISGEPYAFPLTRLDRIAAIDSKSVEVIEGRHFFTLDDQRIGLVTAAQVLQRPESPRHDGTLPVVVLSDRGHVFGIVVDGFLGERDLDVRPLDPRLGKVPNINSASVLEDGSPVLIVDVEDLVRSIDNLLGGRRLRPPAAEVAASARAKVKRVLVVDDSITVRELERQLLESRGFAVDVAVDGVDGWNALRSGHYDLVVSDVDMPRMDGITLVSQIRQDARFAGLPVVIVSYKDREEDRLRGLDAGANSYLTKSSFHDETFLDTVVDLIGEAAGP